MAGLNETETGNELSKPKFEFTSLFRSDTSLDTDRTDGRTTANGVCEPARARMQHDL